jgi:hypothetical protein
MIYLDVQKGYKGWGKGWPSNRKFREYLDFGGGEGKLVTYRNMGRKKRLASYLEVQEVSEINGRRRGKAGHLRPDGKARKGWLLPGGSEKKERLATCLESRRRSYDKSPLRVDS